MAVYNKRVQAVLTEEQFALLTDMAAESGKTISMLIREAVEKVYLEEALHERRQAALLNLLALNAPVVDWQEMEDEITGGAVQ